MNVNPSWKILIVGHGSIKREAFAVPLLFTTNLTGRRWKAGLRRERLATNCLLLPLDRQQTLIKDVVVINTQTTVQTARSLLTPTNCLSLPFRQLFRFSNVMSEFG